MTQLDDTVIVQHIKERIDRLVTVVDEKIAAMQVEILAIIAGNDLRYQQRFEAQGKALDAAFGAAKGAVDAALAGADKAAVKTELSADKRFADLGDLIREQFKGMSSKLDAIEKRTTQIEGRINITSGVAVGAQQTKDDSKALWALGISVLVALVTVIAFLFQSLKP